MCTFEEMKKSVLKIICLVLLLPITVRAQNGLDARYRLRGIHDMAAGFQFKPNGTFEFSYSYGGADRFAKGTYTVIGDTIHLNSEKIPGDDFEIIEQSMKGKTYKVVVRDENQFLIQYVKAIVFFGELRKEFTANSDGEIFIDTKNCEKIYLQHELYPDIASLIKDELNANTYFEVKLKSSLQEVSFKGINLFLEGNTIHCYPNYFMPFENITFVKE
jgi:hypothetical protein